MPAEKNTADQHFVVENYAEETVVFRIRVSVANVFVLTAASGVIEAEHSVEIPIALKKTLPAEFAHASDMTVKLAVEFVPFGPDYESRGSKAFWSQRGADAVRKTIVCVVSRSAGHKGSIHALDAAKLGAFDGNPDRPPSSGAKQVKISPDSLEFEGILTPAEMMMHCMHYNFKRFLPAENKYQCEAPLFLHNPSSNAVAYRIQPSASNEYIVARGNGVIVPGSTAKIPVVLLEVPAATSAEEALAPHSSALMIDLLDVDEGYSDKVAKSVWAAGSDRAVHASVSCIARRIDRPSAGQVLVTPECLRFNGTRQKCFY